MGETDQFYVAVRNARGIMTPVTECEPALRPEGTERTWPLPDEIGQGTFRTLYLPSGLTLTTSRFTPAAGLHARLRQGEDGFTLVFALEGRSLNKNRDATTIPMQQVLHRILSCPFRGEARRFFMEGASLELLALKLDMMSDNPGAVPGISGDQMRGVVRARDILVRELNDPPAVHVLARAAGMSHTVLNRCFKAVFAAPPLPFSGRNAWPWAGILWQPGR